MRAWPLLALIVTVLAGSPAWAQADTQVSAAERYEQCLRFFSRSYYTKALEACNRVRNFHRDAPESVLAELAISDIYFKRGDYEQARLAYEDFVRLHPRHERVDYAVWRIGLCWFKVSPRWAGRDQTPTRQAVNVWTGFDRRFPSSDHAGDVDKLLDRARGRLARKELKIARFYERRDAWRAVRGRAVGVVQRYPDTEHAPEALALIAESWHAWGYMAEARDARDRLSSQHPDAAALLARVDRVLASPPGQEPEDIVFLRPYKIPQAGGLGMAGAAQGSAMPGMGAY